MDYTKQMMYKELQRDLETHFGRKLTEQEYYILSYSSGISFERGRASVLKNMDENGVYNPKKEGVFLVKPKNNCKHNNTENVEDEFARYK